MAEFNLDNYVTVADRVQEFWAKYPEGRILTDVIHLDGSETNKRMVTIMAAVYLNRTEERPAATGWAKEREGTFGANKTAFLENCETSAIGRALANLGILVEKNRPSREEMVAVQERESNHDQVLQQIIDLVTMIDDERLKKRTNEKWKELKEDMVEAEDYLSYLMANFNQETEPDEEIQEEDSE